MWVENPDGTESIHVDGDYFDAAIEAGDIQGIGPTLLQEAAHSLGDDTGAWGHHAGDTGPLYETYPEKHLSAGTGAQRNPGAERCVKNGR